MSICNQNTRTEKSITEFQKSGKILYYLQNGNLKYEQTLTKENIGDTLGMMIRCNMKDGSTFDGYSHPYGIHKTKEINRQVRETIYLGKWVNYDEKLQKLVGDLDSRYDLKYTAVMINDIASIDAILYSGPRWGGTIHNHFFLSI